MWGGCYKEVYKGRSELFTEYSHKLCMRDQLALARSRTYNLLALLKVVYRHISDIATTSAFVSKHVLKQLSGGSEVCCVPEADIVGKAEIRQEPTQSGRSRG